MAAAKKIPRAELLDYLDKGLTPEQIARLYRTTLKNVERQVQFARQQESGFQEIEGDSIPQTTDINSSENDLTFLTISHPNARAFLLAYMHSGTVTDAAAAAQVNRRTHYDWLQSLGGYADAFKQAEGMFADSLERSALLRARDGCLKPVFQGGIQVGVVREYSDTLMLAMLKAKRGDQYKDKAASGPTLEEMDQFDDSELDQLAAGEPYERVFASSRRRRAREAAQGSAEGKQSGPPPLAS